MNIDTNTAYVLIILCFTFIYSIIIVPNVKLPKFIEDIHHKCYINCYGDVCKKIAKNRGGSYFIESDASENEKIKNCAVTFWNLTHFILYAVITFLKPQFILQFFKLGIAFELYEYLMYDCADYIDIISNGLGCATGYCLSKWVM